MVISEGTLIETPICNHRNNITFDCFSHFFKGDEIPVDHHVRGDLVNPHILVKSRPVDRVHVGNDRNANLQPRKLFLHKLNQKRSGKGHGIYPNIADPLEIIKDFPMVFWIILHIIHAWSIKQIIEGHFVLVNQFDILCNLFVRCI
ncbi:MAG: hypothetical protein RBG13Loki_1382 [Promethearchaeota archaeon CR_4]|nr:MAG: hypothetical protein RBG13Loki_1382 [Candidatus Lokiarchaeota archaeon CR_4]